MATKSINAILNLKDNMTKPVKSAGKSTKDLTAKTKQAERQLKSFGNTAKKSYSQATSSIKKMAIAGAGLVGAYAGISFMKESSEAAKKQAVAETKLSAIMKNVKGVTDEQVESLKKHAVALQNVGVIGDEVTLSAMAQLGTFQVQASTIEQLSEGMLDLLANNKGLNATQEDAQSIGNLVGKVMQGQVGALSKSGISFSKAQEKVLKYGTEQERAATLAQVLKENVGGVNKALSETDEGKVQKMTNNWSDFKEVVGNQVNKALGMFAGWFNTKIPAIQSNFLQMKDYALQVYDVFKEKWASIQPIVDKASDSVIKIKDKALDFYNFIKQNWSTIKPILATVMAGFIAYKTIMTALQIRSLALAAAIKIKTLVLATGATKVNAMTIAQWALNAAMSANPVGLIIAGLVALVAIGILVVKNWDKIKEKAFSLWEGIKEAFAPIGEFFSNIFNTVTEKVTNTIDGIKSGFTSAFEFLRDMVKGLLGLIREPFNFLVKGVNKFKINVPDWVPMIGGKQFGFKLPEIPAFAMGTPYHKGGLAQINERGGEIVDLPRGSRVIPADKSEKITKKRNGDVIINFYGDVYGDETFVDKIGNRIARKVKLALDNM